MFLLCEIPTLAFVYTGLPPRLNSALGTQIHMHQRLAAARSDHTITTSLPHDTLVRRRDIPPGGQSASYNGAQHDQSSISVWSCLRRSRCIVGARQADTEARLQFFRRIAPMPEPCRQSPPARQSAGAGFSVALRRGCFSSDSETLGTNRNPIPPVDHI